MRALWTPVASLWLALGCVELPELGYGPAMGLRAQDEALRALCEGAAERWEEATGLVFSCTQGRPLRWVDGPLRNPCAAAHTNGDAVELKRAYEPACTEPARAVSNPLFPQAGELESSMAHEMGHVMHGHGGHSPAGVMAASTTPDARLTVEDLEWLCSEAPCLWMKPE